jgi:hypothetical protein
VPSCPPKVPSVWPLYHVVRSGTWESGTGLPLRLVVKGEATGASAAGGPSWRPRWAPSRRSAGASSWGGVGTPAPPWEPCRAAKP